ncbi:MAG: helix-turn-helix domain-containing protein [Ruminococcus sp.]
MSLLKKIGEILKNAREDKDLTQLEVMEKTGINNKTLSGYENGIAEPDVETMVKLFNFYGISADRVLEIENTCDDAILVKISNQEQKLLQEFRKLNTQKQEETLLVLETLNSFYSKDKKNKNSKNKH